MSALAGLLLAIVIVAACGVDGPADTAPVAPFVDCVGVPADQCRSAVVQALADPGDRPHLRVITVRCTAPSCTVREGQMSVTILLDDGRQMTTMSGWAAADAGAPEPRQAIDIPLPVKPTCAGIARPACEQFARESLQGLGDRPVNTVVSIVVRCTAGAPCNDTSGKGTTDVTFRDGTKQTSDWLYEGATGP